MSNDWRDWPIEFGHFFPELAPPPEYVRWECCGNVWEIITTPRYPERYEFAPRCPTCNKLLPDFAISILAERRKQEGQTECPGCNACQ